MCVTPIVLSKLTEKMKERGYYSLVVLAWLAAASAASTSCAKHCAICPFPTGASLQVDMVMSPMHLPVMGAREAVAYKQTQAGRQLATQY